MNLGIVGHAQEKFTAATEAKARAAIASLVAKHQPDLIISGHSPMGGVDWYAEDAAREAGIKTRIFAPQTNRWDGEYGFKARNMDIARYSDLVVCVVVRELPPGFRGMKFGDCYHCKRRNPPHVKSGGCWTAWRCERCEWMII